jgi:hypothetical protein
MSGNISIQAILAIMLSAFMVTIVVTSAMGFQREGATSFAYRLALAAGSDAGKDLGISQTPSASPGQVSRLGSLDAAASQDDCYKTCMTDKSTSRFMKSVCWLGCPIPAGVAPGGP